MRHPSDPATSAAEIDARLGRLEQPSTAPMRAVRRDLSARVRERPGTEVLALAHELVGSHRQFAYELVHHHPDAFARLDHRAVIALGAGMDSWEAVDGFGRYISGPAWQRGLIDDELVASWAASPDRWWRRAALVSTVPLNLRAAGGTGDPDRTLAVCELLVEDRDDMVVKALSWALRELVIWDPDAVREFLGRHEGRLAARVRREVSNKLATGRKDPAPRRSPTKRAIGSPGTPRHQDERRPGSAAEHLRDP